MRDGSFLLNDRPVVLRSVLSQGYWPRTHLAAPSEEALRAEVELIQSLGFNSARVHQKIEDPRFLYWADRLGLLVWAETPAAYAFTATAVERLTREWMRAIDRDRSPGRFLLTGSANLLLMKQVSESLAGRPSRRPRRTGARSRAAAGSQHHRSS